MSEGPRFSILVPAFDDERFLETALSSIAAQTVGDFEVIVADDGSGDGTPRIARDWATRDRRFRLSRSASNQGMARNWNRALAEARGELVAKLDADDAWAPGVLEILASAFTARPDLLAAFARAVECDERLVEQRPWHGEGAFRRAGLDPASPAVARGARWYRLSFDDFQLWHSCAFLVRRHDLVALGGWDERWSCAADTDLILRLLERNAPIAHLPWVGVRYRCREGSVSRRASAEGWKRTEAVLVALASLERAGRRLGWSSRRVRWNWWRLDRARREWLRSLDEPGCDAAPEQRRLGPLARSMRRAPLLVRLEGATRTALWELLRSVPGLGRRAAGAR